MMPKRIQRKRTKGWRMPENTRYVGRPTVWGNPFGIKLRTRAEAVKLYKDFLFNPKSIEMIKGKRFLIKRSNFVNKYVKNLKGKNLACWCPLDQPCHADILLAIANSL